jgi:hypothetical protein
MFQAQALFDSMFDSMFVYYTTEARRDLMIEGPQSRHE